MEIMGEDRSNERLTHFFRIHFSVQLQSDLRFKLSTSVIASSRQSVHRAFSSLTSLRESHNRFYSPRLRCPPHHFLCHSSDRWAVYTPACVCGEKLASFVTLSVGRGGHRSSELTERLMSLLYSLISSLSTPQLALVWGNSPVSLLASRFSVLADPLLAVLRVIGSRPINKGAAAPYNIERCVLN